MVRSGEGPAMLLVHGVAGSHLIWDPVVGHLAEHFTVLRPDLLGYGRSPRPRVRYTPQAHVEALRRTLSDTGVQPPYVLVGLSMGVNLVLEYARLWPGEVSRLVGIGFPYYASPSQARIGVGQNFWTRLAVGSPFLGALITPVTFRLGRLVPGLSGLFSKIYTPAMARDALRVSYRAFRSSLINCMIDNPLDELLAASAAMPRLFVHGTEDRWCSVDEVERALDRYQASRIVVVEGGQHNLVVTDPERTASAILDHLGAGSAQEARPS